jgi:signal peptidase II
MSSDPHMTKSNAGKLWYLCIALMVLAFDQITKYWVWIRLRDGDEIDVINGFFKFSYTENQGIAFGILNNGHVKWLLVAISVVAISIVVYYIVKTSASNTLLLWSLSLLAAGICGNLVDRIRMGRVIDFILLHYHGEYQFPVFNIADTSITIGAALMAIELFLMPQHDRSAAEHVPADQPVSLVPQDTNEGH